MILASSVIHHICFPRGLIIGRCNTISTKHLVVVILVTITYLVIDVVHLPRLHLLVWDNEQQADDVTLHLPSVRVPESRVSEGLFLYLLTYINISRQLCKIKHVFFFLLTGMIGTIECLTKDGVVESIQQCVSSVLDTQSNNQETRTTLSCSYVSSYTLL
jgi:hypothetical protein